MICLVVTAITGVFSLFLLIRFYVRFSQLRQFAAEIGCDRNDIVSGLKGKFREQAATISFVVKTLDNLGNGRDTNDDATIDGTVGNAMRSFKNKMSELKAQEQQQHWTSKGLALLNDIKKNNESLDEYAFQATQTLVKYLRAKQASFYLLDAEKEQLNLLVSYAYDKRRRQEKDAVIDKESGILGQCIRDRDIIYMTNVPSDYVRITSGLGEATPRCILVVPMIYRDQVCGVFELASFETLAEHEIEFCRKFTGGIAAELSGLQVQKKTSLLLGQSQLQADRLKAQEEVMRQQMEDMERNERTLNEKIREIDEERARHRAILEACGDGVISFDEYGNIQFFNKSAQEIFGYTGEQVMGASVYKMFDFQIVDSQGQPKLITNSGNEVNSRTEINATDSHGNSISLLLTAAQVKLRGKHLFTLFAQKISVDLF